MSYTFPAGEPESVRDPLKDFIVTGPPLDGEAALLFIANFVPAGSEVCGFVLERPGLAHVSFRTPGEADRMGTAIVTLAAIGSPSPHGQGPKP